MLTCQRLPWHCLSQQLKRNWSSYQKTKWKLLHCETTATSNIYHIKFMQNVEVYRNRNKR